MQDYLVILPNLTPAQCHQLAGHAARIRDARDRLSLVSTGDLAQLEERHIADSLALVPHISAIDLPLHIDIGSGGGFPGLPLAIALPGRRFTLLERSEKKAAFLHDTAAALGLDNVTVQCGEFPRALPSPGPCTVTARAVEKPARLWPQILKWLPPGSTWLAQLAGDPPPLPPGITQRPLTPNNPHPRGPLRLYQRAP